MTFTELIKKIIRYNPKTNEKLIRKAYDYSKKALNEKKRLSGASEFDHSYNVAIELTRLKADDTTIVAALLHDIIEKGNNITIEMIKKEFGNEVLFLIDGVTKVSNIKLPKGEYDIVSFRKMLIAAAKDIRVIFIKFGEKLDSLRNIEYLDVEKQKNVAKKVLDLYGPLASRLGLNQIKNELEDLAFKYYMPKEYKQINAILNESKFLREKRTNRMIKEIKLLLKKNEIHGEVYGRAKHIFSIYQKIKTKGHNLYDLIGLRVITDNIDDCYKILRLIQTNYRTMPSRLKDYIAYPKPNDYQSIHIGLVDESGKPVELQIRTKEMHQLCEDGVAAHFNYKEIGHGKEFEKQLSWLKDLIQNQSDTKGFMQNLKVDLFSETIFVVTPKGEVIELPKGSTVVDYAYAIHSKVGDRCFGANVNGRFVPLRYELTNGDVIEILTSNFAKPSRDWLKLVKTNKAQNYIKKYLKAHGEVAINVTYTKEDIKRELGECLIGCDFGKGYDVKLAICCKPLPGDEIIGYKIGSSSIRVHKIDCNASKSKKAVHVFWRDKLNANIELKVEAKDRIGLLAEILNHISRRKINIKSAKARTINSNIAQCNFVIHIEDVDTLIKLINSIEKLKDINRVYIGTIN